MQIKNASHFITAALIMMGMRVVSCILLLCGLILPVFAGDQLIGTPAPEWSNRQWINSPPLTLSQLKGKVILVRFFMESSCPYCRATAPYLNQFYAKYGKRGLQVVGMYTPKPGPRETPIESVRNYVRDYGFQFPVALDNDWSTLNAYWLDRAPDADFTSVSFLIDRKGIVRYIHPGGAYSTKDAATIEQTIKDLLKP